MAWDSPCLASRMRGSAIGAFLLLLPFAGAVHAADSPPLALEAAVGRALGAHAAIPAAAQRTEAARWRRSAAGRLSNPSLEAAHENFGGSLPSGISETTLGFVQRLELGGDRRARREAAGAALAFAESETELVRREVATETAERFLDAWMLQEAVWSLRAAEAVASTSVLAANNRFKAGAGPEFERVRAEGFLAQREVERIRAESELRAARQRLAQMWNESVALEDSLAIDAMTGATLPDTAWLLARLAAHPEMRRAEAAMLERDWRVREARAARVPDLDVGAGARRLSDEGATGLTVGISLPLTLWNPLTDEVRAAEAERRAAEAEANVTRAQLRSRVLGAAERYRSARVALEDLRTRVQPAARNALDLIVGGYRSGRLAYVDVIDGERSLIEADLLIINATAEALKARRLLQSLAGEDLPSRPSEGDSR